MFCTSCGGQRLDGAAFCTSCGRAFAGGETATLAQVALAPVPASQPASGSPAPPDQTPPSPGRDSDAQSPRSNIETVTQAASFANYHQHLASTMPPAQASAPRAVTHAYVLHPRSRLSVATVLDAMWSIEATHLSTGFAGLALLAFLSGLLGIAPMTPMFPSLVGAVYVLICYLIARLLLTRSSGRLVMGGLAAIAFLSLWPPRGLLLVVPAVLLVVAMSSALEIFWGRPSTGGALASAKDCRQAVWGEAGAHAEAGPFGELSKVGAEGEKLLGAALETLTQQFPYVRVFHGVRFTPGRDGADIDHVVLVGDSVYIVDAKNWAHDRYWWQSGRIHRTTSAFDNHMLAAIDKWSPLVPDATLMARIVFTKEDPYLYRIDNSNAPDNICLATIDSLMSELRLIAAHSRPVVDRRLVRVLVDELQ